MLLVSGRSTDVGRTRDLNEDSLLVTDTLFVVADGMGGHDAGEVASKLAVDSLAAVAQADMRPEVILDAVDAGNQAIVDASSGGNGMGTTLAGLALVEAAGGRHWLAFNVGDSRIYRLSDGELEQISVDHSEVEELVLAGAISRNEARTHPRRNVVTRALGSSPPPRVDHWLLPIVAGERFLICSDGLFNELRDDDIAQLLARSDAQTAASELVAAARDAGGRDNITAVVVDVRTDDVESDVIDEDTTPRSAIDRLNAS